MQHLGQTRERGHPCAQHGHVHDGIRIDLDLRRIDTLRTLAIDQVQKVNSGHPGTPMGAAPTAYCLWQRFPRFDSEDAAWSDRDRFVLSVGHASALLYGLLHLCGVKAATCLDPSRPGVAVPMAALQSFRQAGSRCTGQHIAVAA